MARVNRCNYRARQTRAWTTRSGKPGTDQLEQLRDHLARVDAKIKARRAQKAA